MKPLLLTGLLFFSLSVNAIEDFAYSGRLVHTNGAPVAGPVNLKFELSYTNDTSTILCEKELISVPLTNGLFNVRLTLAPADCGGNDPQTILTSAPVGHNVAIRVTDQTNSKTYGHQAIYNVPFSSLAQIAKTLTQMGATPGQVLAWNGSQWEPTNPSIATGSVTEINTASGLSGGPITATGTISIASGGVTSTHIANSTILNEDISASAAIARSKLANGSNNVVLTNNGSGVYTELASLPIALGGTGATNLNDARTNLGIGSSASYDFVACLPGQYSYFVTPGGWACAYDDTTDSTKLPLAGGTLSGALAMGNNKITDLGTPTAAADAATKSYVDTAVSGSSVWATSGTNIYNSNTGNVGIGTTTPSQKLEINGGVRINHGTAQTLHMYRSGADTGSDTPIEIFFDRSAASATQKAAIGMDGLANRDFFIWVNGYDRLNITDTGNVGIGTSSPEFPLHVKSTWAGIHLETTATGYAAKGSLYAGSGSLFVRNDLDNKNPVYFSLSAPTGSLVLDSNGKLGIGTFNPKTTLDVLGSIKVGNGGETCDGTIPGAIRYNAGTVEFCNGSAWTALASSGGSTPGDNTVTSAKITNGSIINEDISSTAAIDATKIASGSVTNTEFEYLNGVSGSIQTQLDAKEGTLAGGTTAQYYRGDKTWQDTNTAVRAATLTGLSATPGTVAATDSVLEAIGKLAGNQGNYVLKAGDSMTGALAMGSNKITGLGTPTAAADAATKSYVDTALSGSSVWATSGTNIYNSNTGNVGIGTTTPATKLDVNGTGKFGGGYIQTSGAESTNIYEGSGAAYNHAPRLSIRNDSSETLLANTPSALSVFNTDGTNNTWTKISLGNRENVPGNTVAIGGIAAQKTGGSTDGWGRGDVILWTKNMGTTVEGLRVTHLGSVGIGTSTPQTRLDLNGTLRVGNGGETCNGTIPGAIRYNSGSVEFCNGSAWTALASSGGSTPGDNTVTSAKITDGSIVNADVSATANIDATKLGTGVVSTTEFNYLDGVTSSLQTQLNAKEGTLSAGTTAQYYRGDKTWQTLNTTAVAEGTNLYFTEARVRATPLTGLSTTAGTVTATDSVLSAIGKLTGNFSNYITRSGDTISSGTLTFNGTANLAISNSPVNLTDAVNKSYVDNLVSTGTNQWTASGGNVYRSSGNVGIGTSSPAAPLDVTADNSGWIRIQQSSADNNGPAIGFVKSRGSVASPAAVVSGDRIGGLYSVGYQGAAYSGNVAAIQMLAAENFTSTALGTKIDFGTTPIGATGRVTRMTIDSSGNVGIGTSSPASNLEIQHSGATTNAIRVGDNGSQSSLTGIYLRSTTEGRISVGSSADMTFYTNTPTGNERMRITTAGNVGIGTSNPISARLHLQSNSYGGTPTDSNNRLKIESDGHSYLGFYSPNTFDQGIHFADPEGEVVGRISYRHSTDSMSFRTNSAERVAILSNGNVGIGTTSPAVPLQVRGSANYGALMLGDNGGTNNHHLTHETDGSFGLWTGTAGSGVRQLTVTSAGNFGIGVTNPGVKLDVSGDIRVSSGSNVYTNSDARYKDNIMTLEDVLTKLRQVRGVRYDVKEDASHGGKPKHIGFIAQEIEKVFPEVVYVDQRTGYRAVAYDKMSSILTQALLEQDKKVIEQEKKIKRIEERLKKLEEKLK